MYVVLRLGFVYYVDIHPPNKTGPDHLTRNMYT